MNSTKCDEFMNRAMEDGKPSKAWQRWQDHSQACLTCEKHLKIINTLEIVNDGEIEGLEVHRVEALHQALAQRKKRPKHASLGFWLLAAAAIAAFVVWVPPKPAQKPFNLVESSNKWAKVAANPEWDLATEHPLRKRIQTLRQDFRVRKPQNLQQQRSEGLRDRMSRLRNNLEKEF